MKKLIRVLALLLILLPSVALSYPWKVAYVIDGDTVKFYVSFLPKELGNTISIRVNGVDTPEKAPLAHCDAESQLAHKATDFTKGVIAKAKVIDVQPQEWDKYGGRILGSISVDGKDLAQMLIDAGLARSYHGEKKASWCN